MSKHMTSAIEQQLKESEYLRDAKIKSFVEYLYNEWCIGFLEIEKWTRVFTKHNPETYFRDWRSVQELNPNLQWKDWQKRQRHATKVAEQIIEAKHEPDIFKRTELVATKAEQAELFIS